MTKRESSKLRYRSGQLVASLQMQEMRATMMNALLYSFLTVLGNCILVGAGDNSVSVLQKPVLSLQLNSHVEIARAVYAATYPLEHARRLQSFDFQIFCDIVEDSGPFSCDCDRASLTAVCDSSKVCNSDTCATFHVVNTFDTAFSLVAVQTCAEYTVQVAGYRNGCVNFTLIKNGKVFDTCEIAFDDDSGIPTECNECRVCDGRIDVLTFDIDCSNIEVEASTSGCMVIEDDTEIFPGFEDGFEDGGSASVDPPVGLVWAAAVATLLVGLYSF
jgi:hypothetical protein